ncbi:phage tail terminator-like protein [Klebsiella quasipneumoniae subsp. similipneumoniae]|uniref:phage tail terminator-like protein n=1 Tax=Bacteria TaxID=2 RepID=UPI000450B52C|nr:MULTISPECIES: phage tail terminator-like protein [Bacteria]DAV98263.1 MAG TPA: tail completion protein [Caudoviricetes sp.]HBQ8863985.1 electron transfer flavoprotein subunit beta [Klebsiella variicola subsp. variicola]AXT65000.1 electron transfer flavoprotein subunit beta [Klebsiella pneumoniae]AZJ03687.1 electron transfer flavoprotein subunit beta [Klebsiella quasipneumoniae]AZJ26741.1 electron transfer flavoprotein subunit beta [Klebsiella quasipneumoniae subsp. similipneumoniae]
MTFTEIRNAVISRMAAQTAIASDAVDYPNGPVFDPSNRDIWARLTNIAGQAGATEIGDGPVVHRTGLLIIQLFVPVGSGTLLISRTADKIRELFEFQDDGRLSYFAVSCYDAGEADGWYQINLNIPYRAL